MKVGDKVKVVGNRNYHHFEIGSEVEIVKIYDDGYYEAKGVLEGGDSIITQTMKAKDLEEIKFKVGQKVRYKNGDLFAWDYKEVTIDRIEYDKVWFKEIETYVKSERADIILELVETESSSVKGFRPLNDKERQTFLVKIKRKGFDFLESNVNSFQVKYQVKGNFTICNVIDETGEVFNGVAKRNTKDRFNKEIGERIAFANVWD